MTSRGEDRGWLEELCGGVPVPGKTAVSIQKLLDLGAVFIVSSTVGLRSGDLTITGLILCRARQRPASSHMAPTRGSSWVSITPGTPVATDT